MKVARYVLGAVICIVATTASYAQSPFPQSARSLVLYNGRAVANDRYISLTIDTSQSVNYRLIYPNAVPTANQMLTIASISGSDYTMAWTLGGAALSAISAATATNTINSLGFAQEWDWNSLDGATAMKLAATTTTTAATNQVVLNVTNTGASTNASITTYALQVANTHGTGAGSTNVGASFTASGATGNNYAIIVPAGSVGIGTSTPTVSLEVGAGGTILLSNAGTPGLLEFQGTGAAMSTFTSGAMGVATNTINYTWPLTPPTIGQVMSATPSGTGPYAVSLGWSTPGSSTNWLLAGNAATTPGSQFLGTTDAKELIFKTSGVQRARWAAAADSLRLGINGNSSAAPPASFVVGAAGFTSASSAVDQAGTTLELQSGAGTGNGLGGDLVVKVPVQNGASNSTAQSYVERFRMRANDGFVNLGTAFTPTSPLSLINANAGSSMIYLRNTAPSGYTSLDFLNDNSTTTGNVGIGNTTSGAAFANKFYFNISFGTVLPITFLQNNLEAMALDVSSDLYVVNKEGIGFTGTTSPTIAYRLDVRDSTTAGSGTTLDVARLENNSIAAANSGVEMLFGAKRTTSGMTNVAAINGMITSIDPTNPVGALIMSTTSSASSAALVERMRVGDGGDVVSLGSRGSAGTAPPTTFSIGSAGYVAASTAADQHGTDLVISTGEGTGASVSNGFLHIKTPVAVATPSVSTQALTDAILVSPTGLWTTDQTGVTITDGATSATAAKIKTGVKITSSGSWSSTTGTNTALLLRASGSGGLADIDLALGDASTNAVSIAVPAAVTSYTITLPAAVATVAGSVLTSSTAGVTAWTKASALGASISALTVATIANTIDNRGWSQVWKWDSLVGNTALSLTSASTNSTGTLAAPQTMLNITQNGATAAVATTTMGLSVSNISSNTTSGTNIAARFYAAVAKTNNYAILVPAGRVGIGTSTPAGFLDVSHDTILPTGVFPTTVGQYMAFGASKLTSGTAAAGTDAFAAFNSIAAPTLASTNSITTTNAATLYLGGAPKRDVTQALINTSALYVDAVAVSTATNSYGIQVNAQTGATNNYAGAFITAATGAIDVVRLMSNATAANNNAAEILFSANSTTNGMTDIVDVSGMITDVTAGAPVSALIVSTVSGSTTMVERMRIGLNGNVVTLGQLGSGATAPPQTFTFGPAGYVAVSSVASQPGCDLVIQSGEGTGANILNGFIHLQVPVALGAVTTVQSMTDAVLISPMGAWSAAQTGITLTDGASSTTGSIAKIGVAISSTGTWTGGTATNTGLAVTATGGPVGQNYAATFNDRVGIGNIAPTGLLDVSPTTSLTAINSTIGKFMAFGASTFINSSAAGTYATEPFNSIAEPTLQSTNAVTTTDAYTLNIAGAPIQSTNQTVTNTTALNIASGAVSAATNSYGLKVAAQTGATNNFGAYISNGATVDETYAVKGEATGNGAGAQVIGIWGDASGANTANTGSIGMLATGNGNTTTAQTNIALQVSDGEFTMGRTSEALVTAGTNITYTTREAATAGTVYTQEGPSGVLDVSRTAADLTITINLPIYIGSITVQNRYVSANSIILVTVMGKSEGSTNVSGTTFAVNSNQILTNVSARAAGSFVIDITALSPVARAMDGGATLSDRDHIFLGYVVINPGH